MSRDPVCGMTVEASQAARRSEFEGTSYVFCSPKCQQQFDADPRRFASPKLWPAPCCGFGMVRRSIQRGVA